MVQAAFIIIDKDRSSYVHRVDQREAFADPTVVQTRLDLRRDVDKCPAGRHLEPKVSSVAFHFESNSTGDELGLSSLPKLGLPLRSFAKTFASSALIFPTLATQV